MRVGVVDWNAKSMEPQMLSFVEHGKPCPTPRVYSTIPLPAETTLLSAERAIVAVAKSFDVSPTRRAKIPSVSDVTRLVLTSHCYLQLR